MLSLCGLFAWHCYTVKEIKLNPNFDFKLDNCSSSIKKITFDISCDYDKELNCLLPRLEILQMPYKYKHQIKNHSLKNWFVIKIIHIVGISLVYM